MTERAAGDRERRRIAGLSFAEILVVWGLRHSAARALCCASLACEFERAFGPGRGEAALALFKCLAATFEREARLAPVFAELEEDSLSDGEESLLALLAAEQRGERDLAERIARIELNPAGRGTCLEAARGFASLLLQADYLLPRSALERASQRFALRSRESGRMAERAGAFQPPEGCPAQASLTTLQRGNATLH